MVPGLATHPRACVSRKTCGSRRNYAKLCFWLDCNRFTIAYWQMNIHFFLDVNCGPLRDIENGDVTLLDNRTTYDATAIYRCHLNYTLVGQDIRKCNEDGVWSGQQPQCLCKLILLVHLRNLPK